VATVVWGHGGVGARQSGGTARWRADGEGEGEGPARARERRTVRGEGEGEAADTTVVRTARVRERAR
jgi:hypothetical protein